ncbi:MAG: response regulator transcription factor [Clostridia bacterium]|nr:response regulator transcription factor [Clostridia bacterium]
MAKILLIEDDFDLHEGISLSLKKSNHEIISAYDGLKAQELLKETYDLILLDVNLPHKNGFDLAMEIQGTPLIFISARDHEIDVLKGFKHQCEDYITKPFSLAVLKEKINVILKRYQHVSVYSYKNLVFDFQALELKIDDQIIPLTKKESQLIKLLIQNKEKIMTKEMILEQVWDQEGAFVNINTVNVTINRIRNKIETDVKAPHWIQTVFGIGYKWSEKHHG